MFYVVSVLLMLLLLVLLSWVWPPDSPWAPGWKTRKDVAIKICKRLKISKKDTIYELGSGDGEFILTAAKYFDAKVVGIEIDPVRLYISKLRAWLYNAQHRLTLYQKNFFDVDISQASVVFMYLVPAALNRLRKKLENELQSGTIIISYRYKFPKLPKATRIQFEFYDKTLEIYVYKITHKFTSMKKG